MTSDFNARVRRDVTTWGGVIGRYGEEVKNRNRQKLGLCATNKLIVLHTIYQPSPAKDIHKYTRESKGRGLRSIIESPEARSGRCKSDKGG